MAKQCYVRKLLLPHVIMAKAGDGTNAQHMLSLPQHRQLREGTKRDLHGFCGFLLGVQQRDAAKKAPVSRHLQLLEHEVHPLRRASQQSAREQRG